MKATGSRPKKRKHLTHTTGRASRRNKNRENGTQPVPRAVIWIIVGFIIMTAIIVLFVIK